MKQYKIFWSFLIVFLLLSFSCFQDDLGDVRDNVTGSWRVQEESQLFEVQYYDVDISKDPNDELQIFIYNFFDRKQDVVARVDGLSLIIDEQEIDGWLVKGTGEMSSNYDKIDWKFTADDGSGTEDIFAYFSAKSPVANGFLTENELVGSSH